MIFLDVFVIHGDLYDTAKSDNFYHFCHDEKYSNFKKLFKTKVIIRIYIKYKPNSKKALAYQSKALMG